MLKVLTVCLIFLCSGQDCEDFDADNCGLYYCELDSAGKCVSDPCYDGNKDQPIITTCHDVTNPDDAAGPTLECRVVYFDYYNRSGAFGEDVRTFCVQADTHFTDCKLTNPQAFLTSGAEINPTTIAAMESYCKKTKCGGLQWIEDSSGAQYFYCDEPGTDGALQPNDFDVANCKNPDYYINSTGQCDFDSCLDINPDDPATGDCSGNCAVTNVDGQNLCFNAGRSVSKCALSFNENPTDTCVADGCGQLRVVRSLTGKPYFYCDEPSKPTKSGATSLHIPILASLFIIAVFTFIF